MLMLVWRSIRWLLPSISFYGGGMLTGLLGAAVAIAAVAMAQTPQPQASTAERGLALALQQIQIAAISYADDVARQQAALRNRIAELERLCGDACKAPAPPPPPAAATPQ